MRHGHPINSDRSVFIGAAAPRRRIHRSHWQNHRSVGVCGSCSRHGHVNSNPSSLSITRRHCRVWMRPLRRAKGRETVRRCGFVAHFAILVVVDRGMSGCVARSGDRVRHRGVRRRRPRWIRAAVERLAGWTTIQRFGHLERASAGDIRGTRTHTHGRQPTNERCDGEVISKSILKVRESETGE